MSDEEKKLLLLQLIRVNGNVEHLCKIGYSYVDVLKMIDELMKQGMLIREHNEISLSKKGNQLFRVLNKKLKLRGLYKYLKPDYDARILKFQINEVYLPNKETIERIEN